MDHEEDEHRKERRTRRSGRNSEVVSAAERPSSSTRANRPPSGRIGGNKDIDQRQHSPYVTMSEKEFLEQSKIHQVLSAFKDDVVRIKSSEKNKWNEAVETVLSSASVFSLGDDRNNQQHHETISREEVGDRSSAWKIHFQKRKSKTREKHEPTKSSLESIPERKYPECDDDLTATQNQPIHPSLIDSGQLLKLFVILHKVSGYCSGILAGLLLARAWFESFDSGNNWSTSPVFSTFLWSTTTILVVSTVIGFINRVEFGREDSQTLRNLILHMLPVLTILVSHYLNQSFQLQQKECWDYLKMKDELEHGKILHNHPHVCDSFRKGTGGQPGFIILRIIPAIAAIIIYSSTYFGRNTSLVGKLESSVFPEDDL